MVIKMKKVAILIINVILYSIAMAVDISGTIRNDSFVQVKEGKSAFTNILENRLYLTKNNEKWKYFSDIRFYVVTGEPDNTTTYSAVIPRVYVKYYISPKADVTVGKSYITLGNLQFLNPFEFNKSVNLSDIKYDKEGEIGAAFNLSLNDVSGIKMYMLPDSDFENSKGAIDIFSNIDTLDFGFAASRKGSMRNTVGLYLKGDMKIGINIAAAYHFSDELNADKCYWETNVGGDYSFLEGRLYIAEQIYFNQKGAGDKKNYRMVTEHDGYFKGRVYSYTGISYTVDEFMSIKADNIVNLVDAGALISPGVTYTIADGLNLTLQYTLVTGTGEQEFSDSVYGRHIFNFRLEGKI